jgi:hypothetical protein
VPPLIDHQDNAAVDMATVVMAPKRKILLSVKDWSSEVMTICVV